MSKNSQRYFVHNKTSNKRFIIQHDKVLCTCGRISCQSSGVQISRDICTHFGSYLYSTKCSWIIRTNTIGRIWAETHLKRNNNNYVQITIKCVMIYCIIQHLTLANLVTRTACKKVMPDTKYGRFCSPANESIKHLWH